MSIWVPPRAAQEIVEERRRAQTQALLYMHTDAISREFTDEFQRMGLPAVMAFFPEPVPLDVVAAGARPGRYNIVIEGSRGGPDTYVPVVGPDGEFVEPTSRVFELLKGMDWQDPEVRRHRREREQKLEDARVRREREELERLDDEVYERYLATNRAFVSMDRSNPWSQNVAGRRGVKRD